MNVNEQLFDANEASDFEAMSEFILWLTNYEGEDNIRGDLARDT